MNKKLKTVSSDIIVEQYSKLYDLVMQYATDENKEPLTKLFNDFEERIVSSPASGRLNYHNCFVGGFVDHVLRVQETALKVKQLLQSILKLKHPTQKFSLLQYFMIGVNLAH